ncbi:hypothetical protein KAW64_17305, partial [bacterium]|nr:hypothetical protein [bacterium]
MTTPPTRSDAVDTLLGTSFGRRQLSRSSVAFFDTHYCGMEPVEHRKRWLNKMYSARARAKRLSRQEKILLLAPRKHGKSETIISISTQFICDDRAIRILLVGSTFGQASKRLRRVKKLLENKKIINDWCCGSRNEGLGQFRDKTSKWGDHIIEVVRPEDAEDHIDPTMEAVGIGGAITGGHFDVIILDDVESKKRVKNSRIRRETKEWYEEVLLPMLEPDGLLLVIGTRKHRDDLYSFMMPEVAGFEVIHDRAIVTEPDTMEPVFELVDGRKKLVDVKFTGGRALWPRSDIGPVSQRRGLKWVLMVQLTYRDQRLFTREWQNVVLDHEDRMFQASWINAGVELGAKVSLYTGLSPRPDPFP